MMHSPVEIPSRTSAWVSEEFMRLLTDFQLDRITREEVLHKVSELFTGQSSEAAAGGAAAAAASAGTGGGSVGTALFVEFETFLVEGTVQASALAMASSSSSLAVAQQQEDDDDSPRLNAGPTDSRAMAVDDGEDDDEEEDNDEHPAAATGEQEEDEMRLGAEAGGAVEVVVPVATYA
jgi:hypothetical protein